MRTGLEMFEAGTCTARQLAAGLRKIADLLEGDSTGPTKEKVELVFAAWRAEMGKNGNTKLTRERRAKVEARLREGYSVEEIIAAIRNVAASDFHRGANETGNAHDDITLICRNGSKLEGYRDMGPHAPPGAQTKQAPLLLPATGERQSMGYKGPDW